MLKEMSHKVTEIPQPRVLQSMMSNPNHDEKGHFSEGASTVAQHRAAADYHDIKVGEAEEEGKQSLALAHSDAAEAHEQAAKEKLEPGDHSTISAEARNLSVKANALSKNQMMSNDNHDEKGRFSSGGGSGGGASNEQKQNADRDSDKARASTARAAGDNAAQHAEARDAHSKAAASNAAAGNKQAASFHKSMAQQHHDRVMFLNKQ